MEWGIWSAARLLRRAAANPSLHHNRSTRPIDHRYESLRTGMRALFNELGLAA
jgi:hypothetical protein